MSISQLAAPQHPLLGLVDALEELRDRVGEANAWSLTDTELRDGLPRLTRALAGLGEVQARLLAEADRRDLGQAGGYHDAASWFAVITRTSRPVAKGLVRLARSLEDGGHEATRLALAAGRVSAEQAGVIVAAVEALPADLDAGLAVSAEEHLIELAADHDPRELRVLGRRILEVVDPDAADEHERRLLEAAERRAAAKTSFSIRSDGLGMMHGRFAIPELHGAMLKKHLDALAAPRHRAALDAGGAPSTTPSTTPGADGQGQNDTAQDAGRQPIGTVSRPLRLGEAFCEYIATRPATADGTPRAGGMPATIVVTMTHESLTGQLETAGLLDTGEPISARTARMLACGAGIVPAVLGTRSQALDLGRKTRFHTEPQRIAIGLRDRGCAAAHCDWPPGMCHIHHRDQWSRGGKTDVATGIMLCPRHHTLAHDARYQMTDTMHGKVRFTRRT